jgi:hypothetical protein
MVVYWLWRGGEDVVALTREEFEAIYPDEEGLVPVSDDGREHG